MEGVKLFGGVIVNSRVKVLPATVAEIVFKSIEEVIP